MYYYWPAKKELMKAILEALHFFDGEATTQMINAKVAELLAIPQEALELEDANSTGSAFSYKMRWARTELKSEGKITNPSRGVWKIIE